MQSSGIYIALGANLPPMGRSTTETLDAAMVELEARGVTILARSSIWHSPAWPDPSAPPYVNAVAEVATERSPEQLLAELHAVEADFGRVRQKRWDSRILDLDLLDYQGQQVDRPDGLQLPHPRMTLRAFVLLPLAEIAPDWRDPASGKAIAALIAALPAADVEATHR
jgi:2-amino-4-hydroxy-6-hydroxymethyldihydropteridine diphosphokinase